MEMALQMPSRYVEVSDDEMMYVEGGAWNSTRNIGLAIDILALAIPALWGVVSYYRTASATAKFAQVASTMSRAALRSAFVDLSVKASHKTGIACLAGLGGAIFNIAFTLSGCSLGGVMAEAIDRLDGKNNNVCFG